MVRAKRRDEWDRFGQLLAMVHNGLDFDGKNQLKPERFWPEGLVEEDERNLSPTIPKISFETMVKRALGER